MNYHVQTALNKECTRSRQALHAFSWKLQYKTDVSVFSASQNTAHTLAGQIEIHECQTLVPASYHMVFIIAFFEWIISCSKTLHFLRSSHTATTISICFFRIHHHAHTPGTPCQNTCYGCKKCWKSSQVTFVYTVLLTIQIVLKQLHNIKIGK